MVDFQRRSIFYYDSMTVRMAPGGAVNTLQTIAGSEEAYKEAWVMSGELCSAA